MIAFFEVADELEEQVIKTKADLSLTWLHRGEAKAGTSGLLTRAIRDLAWPEGRVFVWACGEIRMVSEIRRFIREERGLRQGEYKCQAYWRLGKTEVERMARMTDLAMAAAETDPAAFQESFDEIGMNIEDPTLFKEPAPTGGDLDFSSDPSMHQELFRTGVGDKDAAGESDRMNGEPSGSADNAEKQRMTVDGTWVISIKSPLGAQAVTLRFSTQNGRLAGTMESKLGSGVISDGIVIGQTLKWTSAIERPRRVKLEFSATIDGDSISGTAKMGKFIQTAFKGSRS